MAAGSGNVRSCRDLPRMHVRRCRRLGQVAARLRATGATWGSAMVTVIEEADDVDRLPGHRISPTW